MKRITTFNKLYLESDGTSFFTKSVPLAVSSINIFVKYVKIDFNNHPLWSFDKSAMTKIQVVTLPVYSKIFKF